MYLLDTKRQEQTALRHMEIVPPHYLTSLTSFVVVFPKAQMGRKYLEVEVLSHFLRPRLGSFQSVLLHTIPVALSCLSGHVVPSCIRHPATCDIVESLPSLNLVSRLLW